jgi:hypothetical protein
MGFIIKEENIFVHCKLTDEGRRKISEGKFNPTKFSVGDSEINYEYYRDNNYDIEDSYIISPIDKYRKIKYIIKKNPEDQNDKYDIIIDQYIENEYLREVEDKGFFEGDKYNYNLKISNDFLKTNNFFIDLSYLDSDENYKLSIRKTDTYNNFTREPEIKDYILIKWNNPYSSVDNFKNGEINSDNINPYIWYKITDIEGSLNNNTIELTLDRELPNFGTGLTQNQYFSYGYVYPSHNSMKDFYNSPYFSDYWEEGVLNFQKTDNRPPKDSQIWNLNILYINDIIGLNNLNITKEENLNNPYAGLITYLNEDNYKFENIGIIHFTNNNPSNVYGEKFKEDIIINLPTILWHKNEDNKMGLNLQSDNIIKTLPQHNLEYYNLVDDWGNEVGKIFNELKIIIITDQELLFALSYKSNRNWTLVEPLITFNLNNCEVDTTGKGTIYYGTFKVSGSYVNIPIPDDINIFNGIKLNNINLISFSLSIPFNSNNDDFIWVAIPTAFPVRSKWYVDIFNRGDISGIKNLYGNLFPDPEIKIFNGIEYTIYISNYRTKTNTINFLL